jgi:hypothetical protein
MPRKMAKLAPRPPFGCPRCRWPSTPRVGLAGRPENREYSCQIGSHPGNPGLGNDALSLAKESSHEKVSQGRSFDGLLCRSWR